MWRIAIVWIFQTTNKRNIRQEDLDMAKKGKANESSESLLTAAQSNVLRTNYVKEKVD